jgi:hypothetical protein
MAKETVVTMLELPRAEAYALAELAKRAGFSDVRELAMSQDEAYSMVHALDRLRDALAGSGVRVR